MFIISPQSAASTKITVTNTATLLYDLMNTAGSITNTSEYFRAKEANALIITPEDGDIRILHGVDPTATEGQPLSSGVTYNLPGIDLADLRLIRTGGSDVAVTVLPARSEPGEGVSGTAYDVTLEATDIQIGAVEIKDGDGENRADVDYDGAYNALAVTDGRMVFDVDDNNIAASQIPQTTLGLNHGYNNTLGAWTRFVTDTDDGTIATGQAPQLTNSLMYYYEDKSSAWKRWEGEGGALWTAVVGLYTPTFDPITDDTLDALKVSNAIAANLKVESSEATGTPESGTDATGANAYATVLTPSTTFSHIMIVNEGANPATVSIDGGSTDTFIRIPTGTFTLDGVAITTTAIQAKNAVEDSNYANLTIIVW